MKIIAPYILLTLSTLQRVLTGQTPPIDTLPAAPACLPNPADTTDWRLFDGREVGVDVRLPATFREKRYDVTFGNIIHQEWRDTSFAQFGIDRTSGPDSLQNSTVVKQSSYLDYSECQIHVGNHLAIVQSLRGGGTIFWNGKEFPSYNVFATIQLEPGKYLQVRASAPTRREQVVLLTAVRDLQIRDHVPP